MKKKWINDVLQLFPGENTDIYDSGVSPGHVAMNFFPTQLNGSCI